MIVVIGLDAATWKMINPNIDDLPNLKRLVNEGKTGTIELKERPHSASVWCSIFSGKTPEEHGHKDFVINGELQKREDIKVKFIWDIVGDAFDIKALDIPFVYPPYNYGCEYEAVGYGLSSNPVELEEDMEKLTEKAVEILKDRPEIFAVVYTMLDKISHFHWGEPMLLDWYKKIDAKLGELLEYVKEDDKLIVVSDHGFCDWDEVKGEHTLPKSTPEGEIKGDHHHEAIVITKNIKYDIKRPQDVFNAIKSELDIGIEEKVEKSKKIIKEAFDRFNKPVIAWTSGKDSMAVLSLVRETFDGNVPCPVLHGDTTVKFKEIYEFRDMIKDKWNLDMIVVKPEIPEGFRISEDRENCCHLLKTVPMQKKFEEMGIDAVLSGIRWDEQEARSRETYFSKRETHYRVHPILHWSENDIWEYTKSRGIPYNPLYDRGYRSLGCAPCTKPTSKDGAERSGRSQDKEKIMERLRALGYW